METILINTPGASSEIRVGEKWENVKELLPPNGVVIITDENVNRLYGKKFPDFPVFSVLPGEVSKSLTVLEQLSEKLLSAGTDRSGMILAIGGGVVCDLGGFLASVYMRGLRCGYISTSLLAQVDASVGGKNGVNLGGVKNIIGTIRQPEFVVCDPSMLMTLPEDEYLSGLAELIKTAIIGDSELFGLLEQNYDKVIDRETELLTVLIARSVKFKAAVVTEDERETGLRRILNFGHTFGHAIEMQQSMKHGLAVASGMELAANFSYRAGYLTAEARDRIVGLLERYGLLSEHKIPANQIEKLILHDKKKAGDDINFVFTNGIGTAMYKKTTVKDIIEFYQKFTG